MSDFTSGFFIALFLLFIGCCLFLSMWVSPDLRTGDDFFREGGKLGTRPTGVAFAGDIVHATAVLYLMGIVATGGTDGVIIVACAAFSPLLMRQWLAAKLAGVGGRSFGEAVARHLPSASARRAVGFATLAATIPLLVAQFQPMTDTAQLIGLTDPTIRQTIVLLMGGLVLTCATIGAARGATLLQLTKMAGLLVIAPLLACLVLFRFDGDVGSLLDAAEQQQGGTRPYMSTGGLFGGDVTGYIDLVSFAGCVLFGAAFLPYALTRIAGTQTPSAARRATGMGFAILAMLCVSAVITGYGVAALIPSADLAEQGALGGNSAAALASALDGGDPGDLGKWLLFVICAAFLTVLAAVSVLLLSGASAIVHDLGVGGRRKAGPDENGETRTARERMAMVAVGLFGLVLSLFTPDVSPQFWLIIAYSVTVSTLLPLVVYGLGRRPISEVALRRCVYGTTALIAVLTIFSPAVSGAPDSLFPDADWSLWPLYAPGIVSVPAGFLLARSGRRDQDTESDPQPTATASR